VEALSEVVGNRDSLSERFRLRIADAFVQVFLHLPLVERVRLPNVHGQEVGAILVIIIELDEVNYLAAEWRSGVAAENQH